MTTLWIGCLTLFLSGSAAVLAEGQGVSREIKLENKQGITQALKSSGCSVEWLSYVMKQKNIKFSRLHRIPLGTKFEVPRECSARPSGDISAKSIEYMNRDRGHANVAVRVKTVGPKSAVHHRPQKVGSESKAKAKAAALNAMELEVDRKAITDLRKENAELKAKNTALEAKVSQIQPLRFGESVKIMAIAVIVSFLAIVLISLVFYLYLRKKNWLRPIVSDSDEVVTLKKVIEVRHNGEKVRFTLAAYTEADDRPETFASYYRCSLCGQGRIKEHNIKRHLEHQHAAKIEIVENKISA